MMDRSCLYLLASSFADTLKRLEGLLGILSLEHHLLLVVCIVYVPSTAHILLIIAGAATNSCAIVALLLADLLCCRGYRCSGL